MARIRVARRAVVRSVRRRTVTVRRSVRVVRRRR